MNWKEKWIWWHWAIYGAVCGAIAPALGVVAGIAMWSFNNGYVPWEHILMLFTTAPIKADDCPLQRGARAGAWVYLVAARPTERGVLAGLIFTLLALLHNWSAARFSK